MTEAGRREAIVKMATDSSYAERLRTDPGAVAAEFDVDAADLVVLESLRADSTQGGVPILKPRLSKSSLFVGHPHSSNAMAKDSPIVPSTDPSTSGSAAMPIDSLTELVMSQCSQDTSNELQSLLGQLDAASHEHAEVQSVVSQTQAAQADAKDQLAIEPVAPLTFPARLPGGSS